MKSHQQAMKRKQESVNMVKHSFRRAAIAILTDNRGDGPGLTVKEITALRGKLREVGSEYRVAKNAMIRRATRELGIDGLDPYLQGPTAIAFGFDDPAAAAKTLLNFARELKPRNLPRVKAAWLDGRVLDAEEVQAIADLPTLTELRQQILRLMLAPHRNLLGVLQGPARALATVLDRYSKKESGKENPHDQG